MDFNQLKTFTTVADTANLTKASSLLFLSQPAVSAHIKALEQELGVKLFKRTPKGMELTLAGIALRDDALQALNAVRTFASKAQKFTNNPIEKCSLGTIPIPIILNLPSVLLHLKCDHPNIRMNISQNISGNIIDGVLKDEVDAGFMIGDITDDRLGIIVISPISLCIVGPWSWKERIDRHNWEDIASEPWIATPEKCSFNKITEDFFFKNGFKPNTVMVVDQERTLTELVGLGMGLTLMREDIAMLARNRKELVIWNKEKTTSNICFIYSKNKQNLPIIQSLISIVKTVWPRAREQ